MTAVRVLARRMLNRNKKATPLFHKLTFTSRKRKLWLPIVCLIIIVLGFYQITRTVTAEQSGSSPESGSDSRITTAYDDLVAKGDNYGSTDADDWANDWGINWNRIMEAAFWEPDGTATTGTVFTDNNYARCVRGV